VVKSAHRNWIAKVTERGDKGRGADWEKEKKKGYCGGVGNNSDTRISRKRKV